MKIKRLQLSIWSGAILGIICIIGISLRFGFSGNELFILATWVNRVIMGLVIGLAPAYKLKNNMPKILSRGAFFGFIISGSLYLATGFYDTPGFIAGIVYGIIIEYVATRYSK
jgi:hypothetical protein